MRADLKARSWERLVELVGELNRQALDEGAVVIVEGKRDEAALRSAGYTGPLLRAKGRRGLSSVAARASAYGKAIILVDFDREGERLARRLEAEVREDGGVVDKRIRESFFEAFGGERREIESLGRLVEEVLGIAGHWWI